MTLAHVTLSRAPLAQLCLLLIALAASGVPGLAQIRETRVTDRVFLVRDRPGTPTEFQMIVNAGCADESGGNCRGLAHYLEHLVLVGRNPENKDAALRFFPDASSNGWTNQRATAYTHKIPSRPAGPKADLEKLFGFYAARLGGFEISPAEAARERNVVVQEHDWRYASSPYLPHLRKLDRLLLPDHPLGLWTIGTRESIQALSLDEAKAFHQDWYRPNNVWFVIKGDIDPDSLKAIAEAALKPVPPQPLPQKLSQLPPEVALEARALDDTHPKLQRPVVYYKKLVRIEETDAAAENAARFILSSFVSSQLPGSLRDVLGERMKLATGMPSFWLTRITPGAYVLSISAEAATDVPPETLRKAITDYAESLATLDIPEATVERLKRRYAEARKSEDRNAGDVYSRLIGWLAAGLDYAEMNRFPDRIAALGKADIARLIAQITRPGRLVTSILTPPEGPKSP